MTAEIFGICLVAATRSDFVADVSVRVPQKAYIPEAFPCFLPKPSLPCARLRLATIRTKRTYGAVTQCASVQNRSRPARRHTHTHIHPPAKRGSTTQKSICATSVTQAHVRLSVSSKRQQPYACHRVLRTAGASTVLLVGRCRALDAAPSASSCAPASPCCSPHYSEVAIASRDHLHEVWPGLPVRLRDRLHCEPKPLSLPHRVATLDNAIPAKHTACNADDYGRPATHRQHGRAHWPESQQYCQ
jgi:hypothetical protein